MAVAEDAVVVQSANEVTVALNVLNPMAVNVPDTNVESSANQDENTPASASTSISVPVIVADTIVKSSDSQDATSLLSQAPVPAPAPALVGQLVGKCFALLCWAFLCFNLSVFSDRIYRIYYCWSTLCRARVW